MTPAAHDAASHTTSVSATKLHFSETQQKTQRQKLYYINGGTQKRKFNFIKIFFHLYINRGIQERKFNFIKNILMVLS